MISSQHSCYDNAAQGAKTGKNHLSGSTCAEAEQEAKASTIKQPGNKLGEFHGHNPHFLQDTRQRQGQQLVQAKARATTIVYKQGQGKQPVQARTRATTCTSKDKGNDLYKQRPGPQPVQAKTRATTYTIKDKGNYLYKQRQGHQPVQRWVCGASACHDAPWTAAG